MAEIDLFANQLLEESKRFLEKANETSDTISRTAHTHASLLLAFCALEAHINAIAEEFSIGQNLSAHERGILLEKEVKLQDGEFRLTGGLKITRLEERIEFLHAKFSGQPLDRSAPWWGAISSAIDLRNKLTHVKAVPAINLTQVRNPIQAVIDAIDALYSAIYKRKFPLASQGLQSSMTF